MRLHLSHLYWPAVEDVDEDDDVGVLVFTVGVLVLAGAAGFSGVRSGVVLVSDLKLS